MVEEVAVIWVPESFAGGREVAGRVLGGVGAVKGVVELGGRGGACRERDGDGDGRGTSWVETAEGANGRGGGEDVAGGEGV